MEQHPKYPRFFIHEFKYLFQRKKIIIYFMYRTMSANFTFKLLFVIVSLYNVSCVDADMVELITYNGQYPEAFIQLKLNGNDKLTIGLKNWKSTYTSAFIIYKDSIDEANKIDEFQLDTTVMARTIRIDESGNYFIKATLSWYLVMKYHITVAVQLSNYPINTLDPYPLRWDSDNCIARRFWIQNTCEVQIDTNNDVGFEASIFVVPDNDPAAITTALITVPINSLATQSLQPNSYIIRFCASAINLSQLTSYSLPIYQRNTSQCQYLQTYCGNNLIEQNEQCDNNKIGCTNCKIDDGYSCIMNICQLKCGNSVLQEGEECDNGKRPGCEDCQIVAGYKCKNLILGMLSICNNCGNSLYQVGQQCDNGNKTGCINCTLDQGYNCTSRIKQVSNCTPLASTCGDSIRGITQPCDNGNQTGCINCTINDGYYCKTPFNKTSTCLLIKCGDGIKMGNEKCDNGNNTGCINCTVDAGYTCRGALLAISKCFKCGDNIVNLPFQQCDNQNAMGCINCLIQPGWNCRKYPQYCYRIVAKCGNGERQPIEQCDDGNKVAGDGCSKICKSENGYTCAGGFGELSVCTKLT